MTIWVRSKQPIKYCGVCKQQKPLSWFSKSSRGKDGHQHICKACAKRNTAQWRKDRPGAYRKYMRELMRKKRAEKKAEKRTRQEHTKKEDPRG